MKKMLLTGLSVAVLLTAGSASVFAEGKAVNTSDGLMSITLPADDWYQIASDEDTEMFSDGDCAIKVNFYKNGDTLPAIESADANHELIYTAAASTQEYVMHVVGYVHRQEDFAAVCDAINSIKVNGGHLDESALKATKTTTASSSTYAITEVNYTAYVSADELNVRSTSEDGDIVATLSLGDAVTVTGIVTRNGAEIGWARIQTADGVEGYTSTQFLNTTEIEDTTTAAGTKVEGATRTGNSLTLYDGDGFTIVYMYSDGTVRDDNGYEFVKYSAGQWQRVFDEYLYDVYDPSDSGTADNVLATTVAYGTDGSQHALTCTGIDHWVDSDGTVYTPYSAVGVFSDSNGNLVYQEGYADINEMYGHDFGNGSIEYGKVLVSDELGNEYYISDGGNGYWYDDEGNQVATGDSYGYFIDEMGGNVTIVE